MHFKQFLFATAATLLASAPFASAAAIYFREGNSIFSGNSVTLTSFDDAGMTVVSGVGNTTNSGSGSNLSLRTTSGGIVDLGLYAVKGMFTLLPKTSGLQEISVSSAKLHLYANGSFPGDANSTVRVYRVTTDWLTGAAGTNEAQVNGKYRINSSSTTWSNANGFGTGDYDTSTFASKIWSGGSNALNSFDVTALVQAMYSTNTNYGFVVDTTSLSTLSVRASEQDAFITPVLEIQYTYVDVPEPAAAGAVAVAMVGLLARRRRCN